METIIKLNTTNTRNGNPRRLWVLLEKGIITKAWDEGYSGIGAVPENLRHLYKGTSFEVTIKEYNTTKKIYAV